MAKTKLNEKVAFTLAEGATHVGISHNTSRVAFTLAEGATHVGNCHNTRRVAFTLAEVLITLGIIGIVAALTIPTLVKNYQQKALDNQFIQTYAMLNQVLRLTINQLGYTPQCYYESPDTVTTVKPIIKGCESLNTELLKNLKISKKCFSDAVAEGCMPEYDGYDTVLDKKNPDRESPSGFSSYGEYASQGCRYFRKNNLKTRLTYNLSNGSIIFFYDFGMPIIAVDINGFSAPNKWGHDLFPFAITNDGKKLTFNGTACFKGGEIPLVIDKLRQLLLK